MSGGSLSKPLVIGQVNSLVIDHTNKANLRALVIGQGMVVSSQEGIVTP